MAYASFINADAGTQSRGMVVRTGATGQCLLAQADSQANVGSILGTRLADVLASASGAIGCIGEPGTLVRMDAPPAVGDVVYLSAATAGVGTLVAPALAVELGICYEALNESGVDYARMVPIMNFFPDVPVPPQNSAANTFQSQVVGNKTDDEDGSSIYARAYKTDKHDHSTCQVYPTLAAAIGVTKSATPWVLGAFAVLVPAGTIALPFDIHGLNFGDVPNAGEYEIVIYAGADGAEVEVGRTRFTRQGSLTAQVESPFQTPIIAANSQIKAKLAGSNSNPSTVPTSVRYHTY